MSNASNYFSFCAGEAIGTSGNGLVTRNHTSDGWFR